ncbi:MAG: hypothetical protein KatS3mg059_1409 [Thermomicrobiales bacterium]|nr:MAG: hypothetical protein KatS3mg059_1409 [Thermomicrobiales bacterium]
MCFFPDPETPVTADEGAQRELTVILRKLFSLAPLSTRNFPLPFLRRARNSDLPLATEELASDRFRDASKIWNAACCHHSAAVLTGAWADVDDPVGSPHHLFVMLDDDEVLPRSRSFSSVLIRRALSRWWSPMLGSSRM